MFASVSARTLVIHSVALQQWCFIFVGLRTSQLCNHHESTSLQAQVRPKINCQVDVVQVALHSEKGMRIIFFSVP